MTGNGFSAIGFIKFVCRKLRLSNRQMFEDEVGFLTKLSLNLVLINHSGGVSFYSSMFKVLFPITRDYVVRDPRFKFIGGVNINMMVKDV